MTENDFMDFWKGLKYFSDSDRQAAFDFCPAFINKKNILMERTPEDFEEKLDSGRTTFVTTSRNQSLSEAFNTARDKILKDFGSTTPSVLFADIVGNADSDMFCLDGLLATLNLNCPTLWSFSIKEQPADDSVVTMILQ